jgi:4-amino-4-deoxy-L-arabinose transferase-like glycosyltransferase
MEISKKELKIFLTFFIIYFIFIFWYGANEDSSFDLTRAIIDEGKLKIDSYYNNTNDRSIYNDHYYSNKPIGVPLLASPPYASWKFIYYNFFSQSFIDSNKPLPDYTTFIAGKNVEFVEYVNLGFLIKMSRILVITFTSCLFSALTVLLIYKISIFFSKNEKYRILLIVIYGLATLAFPYATVFFFHSTATFFIFLSFCFLFKAKNDKLYTKNITFAGLASGYAVITDGLCFLISLFLLIYILTYNRNKKLIILFLITNLLAISPLLVYNFYIFGTPFESIYKYQDPTVWYSNSWLSTKNTFGFNLSFEPFRILRILFFPYIGLFFYYPILILSFYGMIYMRKNYKVETLLSLLLFLSMTVLISMQEFWYSINFGSRFLLVTIPFFVLPIIYAFKKIDLKIISILLLISVLVNLLSTVGWNYITYAVMKICCYMDPPYANMVNTFKLSANPLFEKSIFDFFEIGPRSKLIESFLLEDHAFDINFYWPSLKSSEVPRVLDMQLFTSPFGFLLMKSSFITTLIIVIMIFLIWRRKFSQFVLRYKYLFAILFLLSLFYFFGVKGLIYENNWYPVYKNETYTDPYRWMSNNATINFFSQKDGSLFLNSTIISFNKSRTLDLYLNGNFVSRFYVPYESIVSKLSVRKGENVLTLYSVDGCDNYNASCLSFGIRDFKLFDSEELTKTNEILFGKGWYNVYKNETFTDTFRWMSQNGTISIFSKERGDFILNMSVLPYNKTRNMELYMNGRFVYSFNVSHIEKKVTLNSGENTLILHSKEDCDIYKITNSSDSTCLSFGIGNFSLHNVDELQERNAIVFEENWYPIYKNETYTDPYRWMSQNGTISIFSKGNNQAILSFSFKGYGDQTFDLILNNKTINFYSNNLTYSEPVELNLGENVLFIHSHEGCHALPEFTNVCLSVGISNFQVLTKENLKVSAMFWDRNWYNEDVIGNLTCRWMGQNSTIYLIDSGNESKQINLTFIGWSYYKPRTLQISFSNDSKEIIFSSMPQEFSIKLRNLKINVVKFASKEGCDVPARIENSSDDRCLSIVLCQSVVHSKT